MKTQAEIDKLPKAPWDNATETETLQWRIANGHIPKPQHSPELPQIVAQYANGHTQYVGKDISLNDLCEHARKHTDATYTFGDSGGCANIGQYAIKLAETVNHADKLAEALADMLTASKGMDFACEAIAADVLATYEADK